MTFPTRVGVCSLGPRLDLDTRSMADTSEQVQRLLLEASRGDVARTQLIEKASSRLSDLARMMLRHQFARLRRWEQTEDVYQEAVLRLYRSLAEVRPESVRQFYGLAATQVRRTLIDLVRHHFGPLGQAANHDSDWDGGRIVAGAADEHARPETLEEWTCFHETVEALPDEEREAFSVVWYGGVSQKEAAGLLEISERTMIRRMNRARLAIHKVMALSGPSTNGTDGCNSTTP